MLLRLDGNPRIEDLRKHPADSVEALRALLRTGAPARPDPRRKDFYEVDNCSRVFYIHITPRGNVLLLAIWTREPAEIAQFQQSAPTKAQRPEEESNASYCAAG